LTFSAPNVNDYIAPRFGSASAISRSSDIPLLLDHFLGLVGRSALGLLEAGVLGTYPWHGNVRELKRAVERAAFLAGERPVTLENIEHALAALQVPGRATPGQRRLTPRSLRDLERDHIVAVFQESRGDINATAVILGLSRSQLYRRMQEIGIRPSDHR
jgi:DNA-binding NtrC family response regulator